MKASALLIIQVVRLYMRFKHGLNRVNCGRGGSPKLVSKKLTWLSLTVWLHTVKLVLDQIP